MPKKPAAKDWHKADIKCALEKHGWSISSLSRARGYKGDSLRDCLRKPAPKAERLVADAIGSTPQTIWPSRYHADGSPKSGRGERGIGRFKAKCHFSSCSAGGNVNLTVGQST